MEAVSYARSLYERCKPRAMVNGHKVIFNRRRYGRAFATRLRECAQLEGLDGQPVEAYIKLLQRPDVKNSARAAWNLIESGIMLGKGEP